MKYGYIVFVLIYFFTYIHAIPLFNRKERYIIQLKKPDSIEILCIQDDSARSFAHLRKEIKKVFTFGKFEGFVGEFSKEVIDRISTNPLVEKITQDFNIHALDISVQEDAPSHLVRLSQKNPIDENQELNYYYSSDYQGTDVTVYVIDTGVYVDNPEFEGRASLGPNFSTDSKNIDYIGHGTHVAGVLGSNTFGVAKKVKIQSVKVLDKYGQGSLSSVISGLEYCVNHMNKNKIKGIANLSLGAPKSAILDAAVQAAYDAGLLVIAAAGNNNIDACGTSPAGSSYAITVGAINNKNDQIAHFSNWGSCINIFASGVDIHSLNNKRNSNQIQVLSGTSMASPIVAGFAATLLEKGVRYDNVNSELQKMAVWSVIPSNSLIVRKGSPNAIVNNGVNNFAVKVANNQTNIIM
jgi:subtilisin family serine protease